MPDVIYSVTWNGTEKVNYTYDSLGRLTGAQGTVPCLVFMNMIACVSLFHILM